MYLGAAYYPEHWPEERWAEDAKMMKDAGVNMIRIAEFAWSAVEPVEGEYNFEWLDRAIELFADHNIGILMCTMSRTPPPWIFHKYPEVLNVTAEGNTQPYGARYTVDLANPTFIYLAQQIDQAVIDRYAGNDAIIGWHIDNEIGSGNISYSRHARRALQDYLRHRYGSIEALNRQWGPHFWSFAFNHFDEVPTPEKAVRPNPNLAMAWARFNSHLNSEFARWRYERIRENDPDKFITTNFQTDRAKHTDIFELGQYTDLYGTNYYPPGAGEFALDYCRGASGQLLVLEQRSGQPHWSPHTKPGWMRMWAWRSIAHGACGINFFRWRPCRWGQEQYWHGILPHSGRKNRRYHELTQFGEEIEQLGDVIDQTRPDADAAIVMSYESRWALDATKPATEMTPSTAAHRFHEALMSKNICVDAMDPRENLSQYNLVIAPRLYCLDDRVTDNLAAFVNEGGILCVTPRSGVVDTENKIYETPAPGPLRELCGVEVDDYGTLPEAVPLEGQKTDAMDAPSVTEATLWADEIQLTSAQPVATYNAGWLKGMPAITVNRYGKGCVVYTGTVLQDETLGNFTNWLCEQAGVTTVLDVPEGIRAFRRSASDFTLLFLMNFGETAQTVQLGETWDNLMQGGTCQELTLEPTQVEVLRKTISG